MRAGQWEPRRLTSFNDALAEMNLGRVETVVWGGPDAFEQNGVLVYPPGFEEGEELTQTSRAGPLTGLPDFDLGLGLGVRPAVTAG